MSPALAGLWPPASTPFSADGDLDAKRLVAHCKTLLAEGATGLAILGTTSEANSLTLDERRRAIDACVEGGIPASKLLPGTGACAIEDAAALSRHAADLGCAGVLLLPPFYYKNVSEDGLFAFVARVIERLGARPPRIVLYHIPPVAVVGWPVELMARLVDAFPEVIAGAKDSSGDLAHVRQLVGAFPNLAIFPGSEVFVHEAMKAGAVGCISATANINARAIADLVRTWREPGAAEKQEKLNVVRKAAERHGMIPAVKAVLAARYRDEAWRSVRPPLMPLTSAARSELLADPAIVNLLAAVAA